MKLMRISNSVLLDTENYRNPLIEVLDLRKYIEDGKLIEFLDFCNPSGEPENIVKLYETPFAIMMYGHYILYINSDLEETWEVFEALINRLEEDIRLGTKLIDIRRILKGELNGYT